MPYNDSSVSASSPSPKGIDLHIRNLLLSGSVSVMMLSLLMGLVASGGQKVGVGTLLDALKHLSLSLLGLYVVTQFGQAFFRALRYQLLLRRGGETQLPPFRHLFLVTIARNMLVDMFPARAGELGYVALLNRGYRVSVLGGLSSLAVSILFDFIALVLVVFLLMAPLLLSLMTGGTFVLATAAMAGVSLIAWFGWFRIFPYLVRHPLFEKWTSKTRLTQKTASFFMQLGETVDQTRKNKIVWPVLGLSAFVRFFKYAGLYLLFRGVTGGMHPDYATLPMFAVILTLILAEGAAALPVPSFMSFGPYEAGGTAALVMLGFPAGEAAITMLIMHVVDQMISYTLGGLSLLMITYLSSRASNQSIESPASLPPSRIRISAKNWAFCFAVMMLAGVMALQAVRMNRSLGALQAPPAGEAVSIAPEISAAMKGMWGEQRGWVVWSSNRAGRHHLYRMDLPGLNVTQLTHSDFTDTYPRISPDGKTIVFCRSKQPWVSQRDPLSWDVYLLDVATGKERLFQEDGYQPVWSGDGRFIYFVSKGDRIVKADLASVEATVFLQSGVGGIPSGWIFQTPSVNPKTDVLAVTVRGKDRDTVLISPDQKVRQSLSKKGCQVTWSTDGNFLYWTDHGGNKGLQFKKAVAEQLSAQGWLDLPGEYSHQYFPKLSNDGQFLVMGASAGGHEHDTEDYEIFIWRTDQPASSSQRLTFHTGNDCWPDVFIVSKKKN